MPPRRESNCAIPKKSHSLQSSDTGGGGDKAGEGAGDGAQAGSDGDEEEEEYEEEVASSVLCIKCRKALDDLSNIADALEKVRCKGAESNSTSGRENHAIVFFLVFVAIGKLSSRESLTKGEHGNFPAGSCVRSPDAVVQTILSLCHITPKYCPRQFLRPYHYRWLNRSRGWGR